MKRKRATCSNRLPSGISHQTKKTNLIIAWRKKKKRMRKQKITISLTPDIIDAARDYGEHYGLSISSVIQMIMTKALKPKEKTA